jgi:hypothetical protein
MTENNQPNLLEGRYWPLSREGCVDGKAWAEAFCKDTGVEYSDLISTWFGVALLTAHAVGLSDAEGASLPDLRP